ncbi:MAG: hypothetical protein RLZZ46_1405, partial [Bacteroidota bacterium]
GKKKKTFFLYRLITNFGIKPNQSKRKNFNMKKLITAVFLMIAGYSHAQQDPQFSQNPYTRLMINPGYAGSNEFLCGTLMNRQQWVGLPGRPSTTLFTVESPLKFGDQKPVGVGLTVVQDNLGFDKTLFAKVSGAYRMNVGPGNLGIGIEFGMLNKSINGNWVAIDDPTQDALIPASNISDNVIDMGFGLHYQIPGKLNFGISSTHLNAGKLSGTNFAYTLARHYYVFGGYEHAINDQLTLRPNFWLKSDVATTQVDLNVNVLWNNMLWGGLSYRLQDAIVPMLGYQGTLANGKGNYRVGYSYDITTSALRNHSSGSHELMLGFCYDIFPKPKITRYRNVRFL